MSDSNSQNSTKKEYSASRNYNKSISTPNLNLKSTLDINMQSIDSINLNNLRKKTKIIEEEPKKEEKIPELSEIYMSGDNHNNSVKDKIAVTKTNHKKKSLKIAPEDLVAIITIILLIIFMILAVILYNIFIG
jgi:hypothetical protein